jgi:hypothetical protein
VVWITLQKIKVSFTNRRCEMLSTSKFLDPTEKLERRPPLTKAKSILLKASMTMTNNNEEKRYPCLKPLELLKKS